MEIPLDKLKSLVSEAFECGLHGCADLKQQQIDDLFAKYGVKNTDEFRVWSVNELQKVPTGSIFQHLIRGRCCVMERANRTRFMQFDKGQAIDFNSDTDPWDKPMRLIYTGKD